MTQIPPPYGTPINYGRPEGPRQANALAIVSLVCGILGCFFVTPFVAIITGILGLGKARLQGGRGLAITGILLGVLWIVGGLIAGGATYFVVKKGIDMAKTTTADAVNALVDADLTKAQQFTRMPPDELKALSDKLKGYGKCTDVSVSGFNSQKNLGGSAISLNGRLTFDKAGVKRFDTTLTDGGNGGLVIQKLDVE